MAALGAVTLVGAGLIVASADSAPQKRICGREYVKLIAHEHGAYVFVVKTPDAGFTTQLCDRGHRVPLDSGDGIDRIQYRSIVITPTRIGLAGQDCGQDPCRTTVKQFVRKDGSGSLFGIDPAKGPTEVSKLRLGHRGAIAWISCRSSSGQKPTPLLHRVCRLKSRKHQIQILPPNPVPDPNLGGPPRPPTLLDSGTGIDPYSLSITKARVIWRRHGRIRSAPIPPPREPLPPQPEPPPRTG